MKTLFLFIGKMCIRDRFLTCNAIIAGFPVTDVVQLGYKVPADKPSGAGY